MKSLLPIVGPLIGSLLYLAITAAVTIKGYKPPPPPKKASALTPSQKMDALAAAVKVKDELKSDPPPSWKYYSLEIDTLIEQLRVRHETLSEREKNLEELAQRIEAERAELASVTQSVARIRDDIDRRIIRIQDDEAANVKRLAKTYAGMEPASVAKVVAEMDEKLVVKILSQMKDDQNGAILDALAKTDAQGAKLAASLSDRIRLVPAAKKP
ncbi:MAG: MotE family protein [Verrucomicrobiota bacterium]